MSEGGAKAFRTDTAVLVAAPRGDGWLVDDLFVPGSAWANGDGRTLWNALDGEAHGSQVRLVCPTTKATGQRSRGQRGCPSPSRGGSSSCRAPQAARPAFASTWPGPKPSRLPPRRSTTPPGPILFLPSVSDASRPFVAAVDRAPRLGCAAIVVNQVAGDDALARALSRAGFRQHCDYFTGAIDSI